MKCLPFVQTSVFVDTRYTFGGNQLATFWDVEVNSHLSSTEMQGIALEMHFSETTFINPSKMKDCAAKVRIFTPAKEIPFAGHPTLGTAYVLKQKGLIDSTAKAATLELGVGAIPVEFISDEVIRMSQPKPRFLNEWKDGSAVAKTIGLSKNDINMDYPMQFVLTGTPFLIVPLNSIKAVQSAVPVSSLILQMLKDQPSGKILIFSTQTTNEDSNVHVRMFAPDVGVLEDPATGSAAGPLAAYLEYYKVLEKKTKGTRIIIEQGYEIKRPSQLVAEVIWNKEIKRVLVSGKVKLVADGTFYLQ